MRITPACAGKSLSASDQTVCPKDHPPRMRGKELLIARHFDDARITPAYAGKRSPEQRKLQGFGDHPRVCGEKVVALVCTTCDMGSPPHVRGKAPILSRSDTEGRITPACAGKSRRRFRLLVQYQDHPRMCGEKKIGVLIRTRPTGSPPHVRGKVGFIVFVQTAIGITPAYAGKRRRSRQFSSRAEDHPRVCGEKTKKIP